MADGYDALYEYYKRDLLSEKDRLEPIFQCRKGGKFKAGMSLSGRVAHRCPRCDHTIYQAWTEYRSMFQRGGVMEVDCPLVTMYRERRKR